MSENGEIYTAGNKFYTPAGTDGMDKFHLCLNTELRERSKILIRLLSDPTTEVEFVHPVSAGGSVKFLPAV